jgi:predicted ribosomally synthesized peptide with SipW-like signal peptide
MRRASKALLALVGVGCVAAGAGTGTWSAFSSTTGGTGNTFAAGTVALSDNDAGSALLSLSSAMPGASSTGCVHVTYGGTLDSGVRLYASVTGDLAPYLTLTVTRGTDSAPSFSSCASFTPDATNYIGAGPGVVYSGPLSGYPTSYGAGLVDPTSGAPETWASSESHTYKLRIELGSDSAAEARSSTATFTWEARNL